MLGSEPVDSVSDLLGRDHRRLDSAFADAKRLINASDLAASRAPFAVFRDGLERHIDAEEQVLFPAFEDLSGTAQGGPTAVMRVEHEELKQLMALVARELEHGEGEGLTAPLAGLTARIYAHNGKEERILYPMTDKLAREAGSLDELLERLRAF